ncbi:MAG: serine/threonine protein kinase [Desulfobacteraceae bacterium]|nr:serine/threonine protein kinase [Desulfobacteraceae bacterium]
MQLELDSASVANLFLIILYMVTLFIYSRAKREYTGGKVGHVINLITFTVIFLFLSDYVGFVLKYLKYETVFSFNMLLRLIALAILAFGGARFISKKGLTIFSSGKKSNSEMEIAGLGEFSEEDISSETSGPIAERVRQSPIQSQSAALPPDESGTIIDEEESGPTLGRYEIIEEIGRGAMGMVYKAKDPKLNRVTAIKTISFAEDFDPDEIKEVKESFLLEAETVAKLSHPNIVAIYDVGEEFDLLYIAMEYLGDRNLEPFCKKENLLPIRRTIDIVAQIADALSYAHKNGIVHRDIKPANIMLLSDNKVKVTDFGIARSMASTRTKTGIVKGTPLYMSPEQISGTKVDGRSDIFSLGIIFYKLLTGELPFTANDFTSLIYKITTEKHESPRKYNPKVFSACEQIIDKSLGKEPDLRYQSAEAMVEHLHVVSRKMDDALSKKRKAR